MTLKELAYTAQQSVLERTGVSVKRSHIYELLAATFGFKSFAAMSADAFIADGGVGEPTPQLSPQLISRAAQLGYSGASCSAIAASLTEYATERGLSFIRFSEVLAALLAESRQEKVEDDFDDGMDFDDDPGSDPSEEEAGPDAESTIKGFLTSQLLADVLDQAAAAGNAFASYILAVAYRCDLPSSYLYEESLKGRVLTKIEQGWVDAYIQNRPRFEKYEYYLRQAATGGVRWAAAEFAEVFDQPEFFYTLAEKGDGPVNA